MPEIKFGTTEWFKRLNDMVTFPCKFAFYYNIKDNIIQVSKLDSKAKVENVRYKDVAPSPIRMHPVGKVALIQVKEVSSDKEYHDELVQLQKDWGTKL